MARTHERVIALSIAAVFFVTTVGLSALIVYDSISTRNQEKALEAAQEESAANSLAGKKLEGFTPVSKVDKLQVMDTKVGSGKAVKVTDTITVEYTGAVASTGVIFGSSKDSGEPATLKLDQVIKGWNDGIPGMKEGGTRRLVIPAADAYGANPPSGSNIPPNAALVFDVTLVKIGS